MLLSKQMNRATQFGLSTLVALMLLFTPIGFCADSVNSHSAPAHPCCPAKPAPLPDDCARPGCVYMDTSVAPIAVAAAQDAAPFCEAAPEAGSVEICPAATTSAVDALEPLPPLQRFVVFHQFRI